MGFKDQINKIKENWLLIVIAVIVLVFMSSGFSGSSGSMTKSIGFASNEMAMDVVSSNYRGSMPSYDSGFAPEVEERKVIKTSNMRTEVERGTFKEAENKLMNIVTSTDSYLINSNSNKYGTGKRQYYTGYYSLKIDSNKYDAVITQLKEIGEVTSFNENSRDVTGSYTNTEIELETQKSKLERYNQMYKDASKMSDKIELNDRIFNQERTIKYLEDSLTKIDQKIEYTTVSFNLNEKRSNYIDVSVAKFSDLIESLVKSFNSLLYIFFVIVPYGIAILLIWGIVRLIKRIRNK